MKDGFCAEASEMRSKKKTSNMSRAMMYTTMESAVGRLLLAGDERALRQVSFADGRRSAGVQVGWLENAGAFAEVIRQLKAYFRGELRTFDLPLDLRGTEFQLHVWSALRGIPYGETISYRELAERIGNRKAVRAVGLANGCNPIPIIVPCHRVIGSDGSLTGFGGGLENKRKLLDLECKEFRLW
jgi:methylated-DNA-[protein]-cysteine S-methyltransferase